MTDATPTKIYMTLEEFMALPETKDRLELIGGELIFTPSEKDPHEAAYGAALLFILQNVVEGEVRGSTAELHLDGVNVLRPDAFVVLDGNPHCRIGADGYYHGAPDLVVEIFSPSSEERDRETKYELYEQAGVREYWMLNPVLQFVEVYVLESGRFVRQGVYNKEKVFFPKALNVQIEVGKLFGRSP
jgi:Uma2 family endonuclease